MKQLKFNFNKRVIRIENAEFPSWVRITPNGTPYLIEAREMATVFEGEESAMRWLRKLPSKEDKLFFDNNHVFCLENI
jgi:hypothetical protein